MPRITYVDFQGKQTIVEAKTGQTLMEAATQNDVDGIDADCGGACACATCHVYIDSNWTSQLGQADDLEQEMLEVAENVEQNSRLACQIELSDALDGLVVTTPESQF